MYDQVVLIISEHNAVWQSNVPFAEAYASFTQRVDGLKAYIDGQLALMGSHSILKREAAGALITEALRIEQILRFYATKTGNEVLFRALKHSFSDWNRFKEVERVALSTKLADDLEAHLPALVDYGLTQNDLDSLRALIDAYKVRLSEPRNKIVHRAVLTQSIRQAIIELDEILRFQLDNFVYSLKAAQPDFVQLYRFARNVIQQKQKGSEESGTENNVANEE